jgi:hypothetical protein
VVHTLTLHLKIPIIPRHAIQCLGDVLVPDVVKVLPASSGARVHHVQRRALLFEPCNDPGFRIGVYQPLLLGNWLQIRALLCGVYLGFHCAFAVVEKSGSKVTFRPEAQAGEKGA